MSFLIDPPWLYANGRAIGALAPPGRKLPLAAATMAVFWGVSIPLYRNARWTRPLMRVFPGRDGRDFMVNSGVLCLDHRRDRRRTDRIAAAIFASYPIWLWLGTRHASRT